VETVGSPADASSAVLYLLSASVWVAMIGMGIVWPLVPVYARELGASGLEVGLVISGFSIARTLFNPMIGRLSDRRGRKPIISLGLLLYALVSVLYVLAGRVESLILVRFFHGFTSVMVIPIAMALAGDIAPRHRLGLYMGTLNMAIMLGLGVGPILGGIIRESFGMGAAFYTMGGLALVTFVGVSAFIPGERLDGTDRRGHPVAPMLTVLRQRVVRGIFLLRLVTAAGQGCVYTFLPLLALRIHLSSSQVGIILGINILLIASLQRFCGALADRGSPLHQIAVGIGLSGLAVVGMPLAGEFHELLILNILMGLGSGIAMPAGLVLSGRVGREVGMGSVMGITDTGWSLGMIASPILSGVIMDTLGLPSIFYVGGGLIAVGTTFVLLYLKEH
jgi:MFS family permease